MPNLWMDVNAALAEVPVNILPLIDDTDFKSREVGITYDQAGMDLVWNFVTTAGAFTQTAVTPTTGGLHDWAHQGDAMFTIEIPDSGGTINNDTEGFGWFSGYATGVLPWRGPVIGFRAAALNNKLIDGVDTFATAEALATAQTDLDNPNQYKADVSGLATAAALAAAQTDLDTPDQYKADMSGVATAAALATAQADLDTPDQYKADVSGLGTAANQTTLLNRIGAFTGTGVNTVLGFFKALLSKAAATPSDVGGTFDPAADSTEAISEAVATIDANAIADQAWDEATADHQAAGSTGKALTDAQAAGDPWATALPGDYGAGTAGSIIGGIGNLAANVWSYATRTLTQTAAQIQDVLSGSRITIHRGDDLSVSLTGLGSLAGRTELWFTVKQRKSALETSAIIQITEGEGLKRLNGAGGTADNGSITVDDEDAGDITIVLKAVETAKLQPASLYYDVQVLIAGIVSTLTESRIKITADVTRAISAD